MPKLAKTLGIAIRERRREVKLSQEGLADLAGFHRTFMGAVERGETNPTLDTLERVSKALGMTPAGLLTRAEALIED